MAVRPDPEVGYRRPGDHLRSGRLVERRVFVQASPRAVWATLHDPAAMAALFPELRLGPAVPSWPAAATTRTARARVGLLREAARVESLEARPESVFRMRVVGLRLRQRVDLAPRAGRRRDAGHPCRDVRAHRPLGRASSCASGGARWRPGSRRTCAPSRSALNGRRSRPPRPAVT